MAETSLPQPWHQVLGELSRTLDWHPRRGLAIERRWIPARFAHAELAEHVYQRHFAQWRAPEGHAARHSGRASGDPAFVERVALAVHGAVGWDSGWEIIQRAGDWRFVHSGRMQLFVHESEIHPPKARVGQRVAVRMPCLREGLVPGFLYAFSRAGAIDPAAPHVRVYLNVEPERGVALVQELLVGRAFSRLRFEAKLPSDPAAFDRCDAMVVYADPESAAPILRALRKSKRASPRGWRKPTPFAAHRLEDGIALAESPPLHDEKARSFGQHRSGLMAEAALEGLQAAERDPGRWSSRLIELLIREGVDPELPHGQRLPSAFWRKLLASARR